MAEAHQPEFREAGGCSFQIHAADDRRGKAGVRPDRDPVIPDSPKAKRQALASLPFVFRQRLKSYFALGAVSGFASGLASGFFALSAAGPAGFAPRRRERAIFLFSRMRYCPPTSSQIGRAHV